MSKQRAVIAIHGFSGHPEEMRFLGEHVAKQLQAALFLSTIPGHATSPADLARTNRTDWYRGIEKVFDQVAALHDEIIVIGNSFGANLALKLARYRSPRAIVGIAIPYTRWYQRSLLRFLLAVNRPFRTFWTKPQAGPRATEKISGYTQRCYEQIPLSAMAELLRFEIEEATEHKKAGAIHVPTLLISPKGDPFVPPEALQIYQERLGQRVETSHWKDTYHLIVQGARKKELAEVIGDWATRQLSDSFDELLRAR